MQANAIEMKIFKHITYLYMCADTQCTVLKWMLTDGIFLMTVIFLPLWRTAGTADLGERKYLNHSFRVWVPTSCFMLGSMWIGCEQRLQQRECLFFGMQRRRRCKCSGCPPYGHLLRIQFPPPNPTVAEETNISFGVLSLINKEFRSLAVGGDAHL